MNRFLVCVMMHTHIFMSSQAVLVNVSKVVGVGAVLLAGAARELWVSLIYGCGCSGRTCMLGLSAFFL